jgi:23S rRNA (cytidine1920-2'-O)/16S rRNA (cytidine1409-2'-O)-methyltransferase
MKAKKTSPGSASSGSSRTAPGEKSRIDVLMVERGIAPSRERAQALLMAGQIQVDGQRVDKPGTRVATDARIELTGEPQRYASRGGFKLEGALEDFGVSAQGKVCLDIGSSTGGFTDCLLQHGASKVYAVDVTIDQLDWKLRNDQRVSTLEKNARYLQPGDTPERAALIVMDVSFISVTKVLPAVTSLAAPGCDFLILIKPQFELERRHIGKGGIVRDASLYPKAIDQVARAAEKLGLENAGVKPSRLPGAEGNLEFFLHARQHW